MKNFTKMSKNAVIALCLLFIHTNALAETTLKVGYLPILDHLTLLVSHTQDNEAFKEVKIQPKMFKSWRSMVGALKAGVIDAAFILSPLAMDLFNKGIDIKAILLAHRDGSAITVKTGSTIQSAAALKGKKIAIPNQVSTHTALLNSYLQTGGISLKDVVTRVIAPPDMIKAMKGGFIDAFIVAEPFGAKAQSEGVGKILVLTKDIVNHHVECIVVVKNDVLKAKPAAVQEWVDSLIRVGQFIDTDKLDNGSKDVAKMTTKKYFPHSESIIINGLQNPTDRISFSDLNPVLADFQTIVDISLQAGIIDKVNLESFVDDSFYQKAVKDLGIGGQESGIGN